MKNPSFKLTSIALSSLMILSACSENADSINSLSPSTLLGSAFKGPIDNALINILDQNNKIIK